MSWVVTIDACLQDTLTQDQRSCSLEQQHAKPDIVLTSEDERIALVMDNLFATVSCLEDGVLVAFAGKQVSETLSPELARCVLDGLRNSLRTPDQRLNLEECQP